jgi:hypothetical protein
MVSCLPDLHPLEPPPSPSQRLRNDSLDIPDVPIDIQQLLDDGLTVVRVKRLSPRISLKKVKDGGVVGVARDAVVQDARLGRRENGGFAIYGFEGVGVLGEGVDLGGCWGWGHVWWGARTLP